MTFRWPLVLVDGKFKELPAAETLQANASTTANASLNLPHGVAPSAPVDGDAWTTSARLFLQINGTTIGALTSADIGVLVQAYSANLDEYAAVNPTAAGLALLDDATAADQRTTMGLGTVSTLDVDTDGTLAANSDAKVPSQKAVKTAIAAAVTGLLDFKGSTDCSANPNYPAASKGDAYVVSGGGKIGGASGASVDVGDVYVASADNAGGTQASVGASWFILEHNLVGAALAGAITASGLTMATAKLLGRTTASTGAIEEVTVGNGLSFSSTNLSVNFGASSDFRTGTNATKPLASDQLWAAAGYVALTDASTVAVDMSSGFNFTLTIGGNRTLGNPTNTKDGQTGVIAITQDGTGSRTLAYGTNWEFAGGTAPVLSTAAGAKDLLFYQVLSSTSIYATLVKAVV